MLLWSILQVFPSSWHGSASSLKSLSLHSDPAGSSESFQYPPTTFVSFFFFNNLRLHINNEHWWVPQGMAAFLSHMRSAK